MVVLFDVDGTLLTTGGAGRLAASRTLDRPEETPPDGTTQRAIIPEVLQDQYYSHLATALCERRGYRLPGVKTLLRRLHENGHCAGIASCNGCGAIDLKLRRYRVEANWYPIACGCATLTKKLVVRRPSPAS